MKCSWRRVCIHNQNPYASSIHQMAFQYRQKSHEILMLLVPCHGSVHNDMIPNLIHCINKEPPMSNAFNLLVHSHLYYYTPLTDLQRGCEGVSWSAICGTNCFHIFKCHVTCSIAFIIIYDSTLSFAKFVQIVILESILT